jgi:phage-related protein
MRRILTALSAFALCHGVAGCIVGTVVGTAADVAGTAVSTTADVAGSAIDTVTPDGDCEGRDC